MTAHEAIFDPKSNVLWFSRGSGSVKDCDFKDFSQSSLRPVISNLAFSFWLPKHTLVG